MFISLPNMRLRGADASWQLRQLEVFANQFDPEQIMAVQFGKQDIRGGFSITLVDHKHCVPHQMFFSSKDHMLGFVNG